MSISKTSSTRHILITHEKGGTAKTTTAVNLAHGLALNNRKVLLVDMDTRGDVATALGVPCANDLKRYVIGHFNDTTPAEAIAWSNRYRLDIMATDALSLDQTLRFLANEIDAEMRLITALDELADSYDHVVYDTSAASGILRRAALALCQSLVIPSKLEALGIADIAIIINQLRHNNYFIVPTIFDKRANIYTHNLSALQDAYHIHVTPPIPYRSVVNEASQAQQTLFEHAPNSDVAEAYEELALIVAGAKVCPNALSTVETINHA